jgi:hypothetical protein
MLFPMAGMDWNYLLSALTLALSIQRRAYPLSGSNPLAAAVARLRWLDCTWQGIPAAPQVQACGLPKAGQDGSRKNQPLSSQCKQFMIEKIWD